MLISPSFLFLIETPPEATGVYRLGAYELASHLSYFLWGSMPDEELFELCRQGKLPHVKIGRRRYLTADGIAAFMAREAAQRRPGNWPPYGRLAALIVSADSAAVADALARELGRAAPHGRLSRRNFAVRKYAVTCGVSA